MLISINNIELWTHIGISPEERSKEQRLLVTVTMECSGVTADKTDNIEDTVDYEKVVNAIKKLAGEERKTIEKLSVDISKAVSKFEFVTGAKVEIKKFALSGVGEVVMANL